MEWFYSISDQQNGPVSEVEIGRLIANKKIDETTLVWNATLPEWQILNESSLSPLLESRYAPQKDGGREILPPNLPWEMAASIPPTHSTINPPSVTSSAFTVASQPPPLSPGIEWFYMQKDQRLGPYPEAELISQIQSGVIDRTTLVWNSSLSDWQALSETRLSSALSLPPPVPGSSIDHMFAWLVALCPLISFFLVHINGTLSFFIFFAVNSVLCHLDSERLKKAGYEVEKLGSAALIPIYLYHRAKMLRNSLVTVWVWVLLFFVSVFLT